MTSIRPRAQRPAARHGPRRARRGLRRQDGQRTCGGRRQGPRRRRRPPPAEVGVVTVAPKPVGLVTELPGRLEASRVAQVRARVPGILLKRVFVEGSDVKAGQLLFQIDSAPLQSQVAAVQAQIARAQANVTQATAQAERYKPLVEANAISKQDYINAVAAQKTAEADVAASKASLQSAQINLGYASVTAPISGRIGRALVTEGALVGQGEATPLALVQQINPMYVNFTQSTTELLDLRRAVESGRFKAAGGANAASVAHRPRGRQRLSAAGQAALLRPERRSDLGPDHAARRGAESEGLPAAGHVRAGSPRAGETPTGIVVPQQAVQRGSTGDSVMVVDAEGKVSPRPVKVGTAQGGHWVILDGVKTGEMVMVDGFQKLRGDAPVKPVPWQPAGARQRRCGRLPLPPRRRRADPPWPSSSSTGRSSRG